MIQTLALVAITLVAITIVGYSSYIALQDAQATICPIDQVEEQLDAANKAYEQQNYIEVKNNLDSIQELVNSVKDEE